MLTLLESLSPESSIRCEDEVPPLDAPRARVQSSDAIPVIHPPLTRAEEHSDAVGPCHGITKIKKWIQMGTKKSKDFTLHEPDRDPRKSRWPGEPRPPTQSPAKVDTANVGPPRMAAAERVPVSALDARLDMVYLTHLSEWSRHRFQILHLPRVCMQGFVRPYSPNRLSWILLTLANQTKVVLILDKGLQIWRQ